MKEAVQEIRNTVTVNTSDISAKSSDDKDVQKEGDKLTRKKGGEAVWIYLFHRYFYRFQCLLVDKVMSKQVFGIMDMLHKTVYSF